MIFCRLVAKDYAGMHLRSANRTFGSNVDAALMQNPALKAGFCVSTPAASQLAN